MDGAPVVELLTREGCSLCRKTRTLLDHVAADRPLRVVEVDIDADPALAERYGIRIPVVRVDGRDVCEGVVTLTLLRAGLREAGL